MSVPVANSDTKAEMNVQPMSTPSLTINVDTRTVKVSNVSKAVTEKDIWEFFNFSGGIHFIEMQRESETTQQAFVTFSDTKGAETAILLTGATIGDHSVTVNPAENYNLPPQAPPLKPEIKQETGKGEAVQKAEEVVSTMLAKGFVLGKDALNKAKSFDERHHFTSQASATVASLDRKIGLTEKLSLGTAVVNEKMKQVDERYQVSEITKSALAAAEQKASSAGSALMSNPYVSSGASWVSGALASFAKAAEEVGTKTKEKVDKAEEEKKEALYKERAAMVNDFAQFHLDESSIEDPPVAPAKPVDESKLSDPPVAPAKSTDDSKLPDPLMAPAKSADESKLPDPSVAPARSADESKLPDPSLAPAKSPDESKLPDLPAAPAKSTDESKLPDV